MQNSQNQERLILITSFLFLGPAIPNTAIVVKDLTKVFTSAGLLAVNRVSFHFPKGQCFGLLGVNGAGKTTTFRMLTGDEVSTDGDARIGNNYLSHGRRKVYTIKYNV